jgi:hypothetical protein
MCAAPLAGIFRGVSATYAVTWRDGGRRVYAGRLELGPDGLVLQGGSGAGSVTERLAYDQVASVRRARSISERVRNSSSLVLELVTGAAISIACVGQPGVLNEVADRIAAAV